jgi:asparagine synthase (glutamine-hydrolysing)
MCGIVGKIDFDGPVDIELLQRMCMIMEHRGPDSRGLFVEDGVGLGVQRLAIIDVAGGDQPIYNEDRSLAVVLNGEIYTLPTAAPGTSTSRPSLFLAIRHGSPRAP